MVKIKQNLFKIDKNENSVCLITNKPETHKQVRNRYINICFLYYLNLILSILGVYYEWIKL